MENEEFTNIKQWLGQSRNQLEALFDAGNVPVVGWLRLIETIKNNDEEWKRKVGAEVDENHREREQVAEQIKNLLEKQEELEIVNKQLQEKMKRIEQIDSLGLESESIALLGDKEAASLEKVKMKMKNQYFMRELDFEDVSTLFSMFQMDSMFSRFKKYETNNNMEELSNASVADLQIHLNLDFSEAVEILFRLKLIENREEGVESHLSSCSICSSKNVGLLLKEYGMKYEDPQIDANFKDWKGYFLVAMNGLGVASALELQAGPLRSELVHCLTQIKRVHKWKQE